MPFGGHYRHKMEEIGGHFEVHGILEDIMEIWEDIPVFPNLTRPSLIDLQRKIIFNLWVECVLNCSQCVAELKFTLQMARMAFKWSP